MRLWRKDVKSAGKVVLEWDNFEEKNRFRQDASDDGKGFY
jgi:hypothetical protein